MIIFVFTASLLNTGSKVIQLFYRCQLKKCDVNHVIILRYHYSLYSLYIRNSIDFISILLIPKINNLSFYGSRQDTNNPLT